MKTVIRHGRPCRRHSGWHDRSCVVVFAGGDFHVFDRLTTECIFMSDNAQTAAPGPSIGGVHEVRGIFSSTEQMQTAIQQLSMSGFDRADLAVPEPAVPVERSTPESGALPADTDQDARQARTMHTSTAAAIAALAGAGVTVATGGAAAAAAAAAVAAGAAVGGAAYAVSTAVNEQEQTELDTRAALGRLTLSVRTPTEAKRSEAEGILRAAGAMDIQAV
jgi:hypothetical protein